MPALLHARQGVPQSGHTNSRRDYPGTKTPERSHAEGRCRGLERLSEPRFRTKGASTPLLSKVEQLCIGSAVAEGSSYMAVGQWGGGVQKPPPPAELRRGTDSIRLFGDSPTHRRGPFCQPPSLRTRPRSE